MNFDFEEFIREIHKKYEASLSLERVKELLNIDDAYNLDARKSYVKRLALRFIQFSGIKSNDDEINYSSEINSGINIWIADNLKGKSSLFKIIQFALTGNNNIKNDIKKWLKEILLNFDIDDKNYTIYVNLEKSPLLVKFYQEKINSIEELKSLSKEPVFESKGVDDYKKQIQQFFFDQFSYYSMKWTQKDSKKDSDKLLEANASWSTYFKSIYLESKDSDKLMYGDQGKKVFQMLLGLELTYPINRLTVKKDMLENQKAKQQSSVELLSQEKTNEKAALENQLKEINLKLEKLSGQNNEKLAISSLYEERNQVIKTLETEISRATSVGFARSKSNELKAKRDSIQSDLNKISREINATERRIIDYEQYVEIGSFFSNLDIKHCPSCNHSVLENRSKTNSNARECFLCHESVEGNDSQINKEAYLAKTEELRLSNQRLAVERLELEKSLEPIQREYDETSRSIEALEKEMQAGTDTAFLMTRLSEIENKINAEREKERAVPADTQREELISQKAVADYLLKQFGTASVKQSETLAVEIELLEYAINQLSEYRYRLGEKILNRLSKLMLAEIHEFGLNSITSIEITDNFDILYEQDGDLIAFNEIAEGEQLRAKLAFYLSLIQLEIEQNVGRHTRLLIIDSPAKEEGDSAYLEGLSDVLRNIEKRLGDKLQILIGTAERGFIGVASNSNG
jgi:hypothetical protein